jgi:hypothetical protein
VYDQRYDGTMARVRLTVSLPEELGTYVRRAPNASALVAEAVSRYRTDEARQELEAAYREDALEAARINADWESADAEPSE